MAASYGCKLTTKRLADKWWPYGCKLTKKTVSAKWWPLMGLR